MSKIMISIANQYSRSPAGRYLKDGPYSGERFRDDLLYPALANNDSVEIDLDGTLGYGSSFLEEAFGGLLRNHPISLSEVKKKLKINSSRKMYAKKIWDYLEQASQNLQRD